MHIQSQTVGEIAAGSEAAIRILEGYGIDYCCAGNRSFEEACREKGLSSASVANEITFAATSAPAQSRNWNAAPLRELIHHIVSAHHEFLKLELPRIGQRVRKVAEVHGEKDPALHQLQMVYEEMWQELDLHMHKEEMMLFPAIERYEAAAESGRPLPPAPFGSIANPVGVMEAEHDGAGLALRRMRELTGGYLAPPYACSTYNAMLDGLRALESDLHTHIHLENNVLFPRATSLEKRCPGIRSRK